MVIRQIRNFFSRKDPQLLKKRLAIIYAASVWSIFGIAFVKYKSNKDAFQKPLKVDENEKPSWRRNKDEQYARNQEIAEHVGDNVYTPLEFLA